MSINLLSEDLQNKISAGEVVRGLPLLYELLENSLDADSNKLIYYRQGGHQ